MGIKAVVVDVDEVTTDDDDGRPRGVFDGVVNNCLLTDFVTLASVEAVAPPAAGLFVRLVAVLGVSRDPKSVESSTPLIEANCKKSPTRIFSSSGGIFFKNLASISDRRAASNSAIVSVLHEIALVALVIVVEGITHNYY